MYDGKRIAVVFSIGGNARVVCGRVTSDEDLDLGPVLRVELEQNGDELTGQTILVIQEESLPVGLRVDDRYGCDLCLDLAAA